MPNEARRWLWIFLLTAASVFVTRESFGARETVTAG
jgi:hypothetical protein